MKAPNLPIMPSTLSEIKAALGIATVLVAIVWSYANVSTQLALLNQKTDTIIQTAADEKATVQVDTDKLNTMEQDLTRLDTIIADAQARGLLSARSATPASNNIAAKIMPTPTTQQSGNAGQSAQTTYNIALIQPTPKPQPTSTPTPGRRPTPSPAPSLLPSVLSALGL